MKVLIDRILLFFIHILNWLIPKEKNSVFFYSSPDFSDNARALYEEMRAQGLHTKYRITWSVKDIEKYRSILPPDVHVVAHRSVRGMWRFCRARFLIRTHSLWGNRYIRGRQVMIVAWHGMPFKLLTQTNGKPSKPMQYDFLCVTSPCFQNFYAELNHMPVEASIPCGLPRNDQLLRPSEVLQKMGLDSYSKVLIWMPTFRNSTTGYKDGKDNDTGLPTVEMEDLSALNECLKAQNYLLVVKLHPWAKTKIGTISMSNILLLRDCDIPYPYTLYALIGQCDILITDYSSVFIDFLLTEKEICFVYDDMEAYQRTRGFVFDTPEDYMPGEKIKSFSELLRYINAPPDPEKHATERKALAELFHAHLDDKSSMRMLKTTGIE